jgi:hypothetical protein
MSRTKRENAGLRVLVGAGASQLWLIDFRAVMPRTISSAQTFLMKVVLPALWVGGFFSGAVALLLGAGTASGRAIHPPQSADMKWISLACALVGAALIYWTCVRLKRVEMTDSELHISNFLRELVVPLHDIDEITENRWLKTHPVTIRFKRRTEFGYSIVFMPKTRWFAFRSSHPIVAELRAAATPPPLAAK